MRKHTLYTGKVMLVAHCADGLDEQAQWLLRAAQSFEGRGKGLADGVRVQIGWSLLTLRRHGAELWLYEPNFGHDPLSGNLRPDVTVTLMVLQQQRDVMLRLGELDYVALRFDDTILTAKGCLTRAKLFLDHRWDANESDSGWYIGVEGEELEDKPENYEKIYAYHLLETRPALLSVLVLPRNYMAFFKGDQMEGICDENGEEVWNGTA